MRDLYRITCKAEGFFIKFSPRAHCSTVAKSDVSHPIARPARRPFIFPDILEEFFFTELGRVEIASKSKYNIADYKPAISIYGKDKRDKKYVIYLQHGL